MVDSDAPDSPVAAAAGVKPGEIVVSCEGRALFTPSDLAQALEQKEAGQEVMLEIERAGSKQPVKIKLDRRVP